MRVRPGFRPRGRVVLWGARERDVQFGSFEDKVKRYEGIITAASLRLLRLARDWQTR